MSRETDASQRATLSASEVGRYVYCARAWWLQRVQGLAPENRAALERGSQRHTAHGRAVAAVDRKTAWVRWLVALALALALALILSFWTR
jgi:CRISPR/Cas system-associated exonuclease Cas4 (RecB family)